MVYVLAVAGATLLQRSFIYNPTAPEGPPAIAGLPIQAEHIETADHQRLVAWWLAPKPGKPVVLFFNGNGGRLEPLKWRMRRLAGDGVGMLAVAYRGYSGSTGSPSEAGLNQDALAAYGWLARRYRARDIIVHGFSLGTGVAVHLAAERPVRAVVLEAPYTSMVEVAAERTPWIPVKLLLWDRFQSSRWIEQVRAPVLIAHGDHDSVIPFAMGRRLYELAPGPKVFVRMHGSDHSTMVRDGLYDRLLAFIDAPTPALWTQARDEHRGPHWRRFPA
jgi:pimeloyl-ACP methyl ester carboxylesterase